MIIEVLVAQRQPEDPLPYHGLHTMLHEARVAPINEALGKPTNQPEATINLAQQQRSRIRRDVATLETGHHRTTFNRFKFE
jgi:hypothetical protein